MSKKTIEKVDVDWSNQDEFPDQLGENGFSVDVLIYCEDLDIHQIGFYQYSKMKWHFLCNEQHIVKFTWRYFNEQIDK